ncbi:MAG: WXG100 family type VII secretion target [Lachnospiraceae bacterium]|nr:WXG100 family type VII secretion target [Lachnospiraceae bacterium]MBP3506769.1 WXG100 family type VII secretion target [Lachnospiraceae bacterium]
MATIRLTPEELAQHGTDIQGMGEEIGTIIAELDTKIETVVAEWDGLAQDAFYNSYSDMKDTLKSFADLVTGFGQQVSAAAEAFESVDTELQSAFQG